MDRFDRFLKQPADREAEEKRILTLLTDSTYVEQLRHDRDDKRVREQLLEIKKLAPLQKARDEELPRLKAARVTAEEKTAKLSAERKQAQRESSAAAAEESTRIWWFQAQEEKVIAHIKTLAPECINECIAELHQLETDTRTQVRTDVRESQPNPITGRVTRRFESNIKAIENRVNAIRSARKAAEGLKLKPLSEAEILKRLEQLKANLPSADEYEVVNKPVPDASELRRSHL